MTNAPAPAPTPTPAGRFLRACRGLPVDRRPIWLMRQAGRYMPEYRAVRARHSLLEICQSPALAAEVTITAAEHLNVDAAIIFADLLLPALPLGFELDFLAGEGPRLAPPLRAASDIARLRENWGGALDCVPEAIARVARHFGAALPVIGFAGAPFTLASYLIEGGPSRHYLHTRRLMQHEPDAWAELMRKLSAGLAAFLADQAATGAGALQIFDSWVGVLGPEDFRRFVLPHLQDLVARLRPLGVPVIYFSTGTSGYIECLAEIGADVLSLDWRLDLDAAWRRLEACPGPLPVLQGNLDPACLLAPPADLLAAASRLLRQAEGRPGYIFNLGHGILPETPVDNVRTLVDLVHAHHSTSKA